jgi:hypothetical protein
MHSFILQFQKIIKLECMVLDIFSGIGAASSHVPTKRSCTKPFELTLPPAGYAAIFLPSHLYGVRFWHVAKISIKCKNSYCN